MGGAYSNTSAAVRNWRSAAALALETVSAKCISPVLCFQGVCSTLMREPRQKSIVWFQAETNEKGPNHYRRGLLGWHARLTSSTLQTANRRPSSSITANCLRNGHSAFPCVSSRSHRFPPPLPIRFYLYLSPSL